MEKEYTGFIIHYNGVDYGITTNDNFSEEDVENVIDKIADLETAFGYMLEEADVEILNDGGKK